MFGFYDVIGRVTRSLPLVLLAAVFGVQASSAQVEFPSNVHAKSVLFVSDGGNEVELVGTHSYGLYRSIPGAVGTDKWSEPTGLTLPITVNELYQLSNGTILLGAAGSGGQQTNTAATGLFTSADAGVTWSSVLSSAFDSLAVHTVQAIAQSPVDSVIIMSADGGNLFRSQDHGASWTFNGRLPGGSSQTPWSIVASATVAGTYYVGTPGYGVYVTTDHGGVWNQFADNSSLLATTGHGPLGSAGAGGGHVFDLELNPASTNQLYAATAKGVWRFDDVTSGQGTWTRMAAADSSFTLLGSQGTTTYHAHPEVRAIAFDTAGTTMHMATWGFGVLTTAGFTGTPTPTQIALRHGQASAIAVSPSGAILIGTDNGVFEIGASATANEPLAALPDGYALSQNYPNPFNPTTTISFDLPVQADVTMVVYDLLGRQVATLANGVYPGGKHNVTFDAMRLQSGLYIYRLDAGDRSIVKTMTLLK